MKSITKDEFKEILEDNLQKAEVNSFEELIDLTYNALTKLELNKGKVLIQSIPDDTRVVFKLRNISTGWDKYNAATLKNLFKELKVDDGIECNIECLVSYTELGTKEMEYYDVRFDSGEMLTAISGYHLENISNGKGN